MDSKRLGVKPRFTADWQNDVVWGRKDKFIGSFGEFDVFAYESCKPKYQYYNLKYYILSATCTGGEWVNDLDPNLPEYKDLAPIFALIKLDL